MWPRVLTDAKFCDFLVCPGPTPAPGEEIHPFLPMSCGATNKGFGWNEKPSIGTTLHNREDPFRHAVPLSPLSVELFNHCESEGLRWEAIQRNIDERKPLKNFDELDLILPLQRALAQENYTLPTPIQAQTIPAALEGRDVLGCAQTGTGKTAAFALPILHRLAQLDSRAKPNRPSALVLSPTRELAVQIGESFSTYGRHLQLRTSLVYGGVSQGNQIRNLKRGADVVVATPGRLLDLMNQGHIELSELKAFVLDEADQMLNMGFLPDLRRIIKQLPKRRQSLFFSATLPPKIMELSKSLLRNPLQVNVTPKTTTLKKIRQGVFHIERGEKQSLLKKILMGKDVDRALVFTKTKRGANRLSQQLERSGIGSTAIHGNKSQNARQSALDAFRKNTVRVLVATDVAARGIDVDGITHVVNYDLPIEAESYVHRIGRTGRAGAAGIALTFCTSDEIPGLRAIERLIGQKVPIATVRGQAESRAKSHAEEPPVETRSARTPERRRSAKGANASGTAKAGKANGTTSMGNPSESTKAQKRNSPPPQKRRAGKPAARPAAGAPKGAYSQLPDFAESSDAAERPSAKTAADKPKRRRRRRKSANRVQPAKQTT